MWLYSRGMESCRLGWRCHLVVESFPGIPKALGPIPDLSKGKGKVEQWLDQISKRYSGLTLLWKWVGQRG